MPVKCLFLTGGVVSSLGKGLTSASLALLLERQGVKVGMLKLDPYLNMDPGTMNPFEHGEVYVTDDGMETDLDLGHYHRFSSVYLSQYSTATSGQIYSRVIQKERDGYFLGSTVQVVPHVTQEIIRVILDCGEATKCDVLIVEVGGTVGDIESLPFLEAIRLFCYQNPGHTLNLHMTYVPFLESAQEFKTKPSQHSIQNLRSLGIMPDSILCRSHKPFSIDIKKKISLFCNVPETAIFNIVDTQHSIYELPLILSKENIAAFISKRLSLPEQPVDLTDWEILVARLKTEQQKTVKIALVGKYLQHIDAYKSIYEAITHARLQLCCETEIVPIDPDDLNLLDKLSSCDCCLVPGGFGSRGWEGKIRAATYCREHHLPYLGICLGMQALAVEYARSVLHLNQADSTEMNPQTPHPLIRIMSGSCSKSETGGSMRIGAYPCVIDRASKAYQAYQQDTITERHRHRYEVNPEYLSMLNQHGLKTTGVFSEKGLCEIMEVEDHPWMVGVQFHPEFLSKLIQPHPLFIHFLQAALNYAEKNHIHE